MAKVSEKQVINVQDAGNEINAKGKTALIVDYENYRIEAIENNSYRLINNTDNTDVITINNASGIKYIKKPSDADYSDFLSLGIIYNAVDIPNKKGKFTGTKYNDEIVGTDEINDIKGNDGNDTIIGSIGADKLTGGKGENKIVYNNANQINGDIITLTKSEKLTIDISAFADSATYKVNKNNFEITAGGKTLTIANFGSKDVTNNGTKKVADESYVKLVTSEKEIDLRTVLLDKLEVNKNYTGTWHADNIDASGYENAKNKGLTIDGKAGNDVISGSKYDDTLKAGTGIDTITGGKGNDKLYAGTDTTSKTTFIFSAQGGSDTIYSGKGEDTIKLTGEVNISTLQNKKDLIINYSENDSVTIKDYYTKKGAEFVENPKNTVKYIQIGNGQIINIESIIGQNVISETGTSNAYYGGYTLSGTEENDLIIAQTNTKAITPRNGDDTIYGGEKTESYDFRHTTGNKTVYVSNPPKGKAIYLNIGQGNNTIYGAPDTTTGINLTSNASVSPKDYGDNTFYFRGAGAHLTIQKKGAYEETVFTKSGNDLTYRYGDTSFTFKDYYTLTDTDKQKFYMHAYDSTGNIKAIGGRTDFETLIEDKGGVLELTNTPTSGNDYIVGTQGNDTINALAGNDYIDPKDGNDSINLGAGNDFVKKGDGNKNITAVSGNNIINLGSGNNTVKFGTGSDTLLSGSGENNIEFLSNDYTSDTYYYGSGNDTLTFKNYNLSEFMADRTGSNIVIKNKTNDDTILTVNNYNNPTHVLNFKGKNDTTSTTIDNINTKLGSSTATKVQTLITNAGNDIIYAGKKDDIINAGAGENKIYFTKETTGNNNTYTYEGGNDTFVLPDTLANDFSTVKLQKDGRDLNVAYNADFANNTVKIKDFYDNNGNVNTAVKNNISFKIGENTATLSDIFGDGSDIGEVLYCDENHTADASASDKAMTIKGCEEADTITGSDYSDYIVSNGGADSIIGGAGSDTYLFDVWGNTQATITDSEGDSDILQINTTELSPAPYFEVTLEKDGYNYVVVDGEVQFTAGDLYINKDSNYTFENAKNYNGIKVENFFTTGRIETIQNTSTSEIFALSDKVLTIMQKEIANFLYRNNFDSTQDALENGTDEQKADLANLYHPILNASSTVPGTDGNDLIIVRNNYTSINPEGGNDIIYAPQSVNNSSVPVYSLKSGNNTLYLSDINAGHIVLLGSGNDTIYGATASSATIRVSESIARYGNIGDNTLYCNGASYQLVCYKNGMWEECAFTQTDNDLIYRYGDSSIAFKDYFNLSDDDRNNKFTMFAYNYNGEIVRNNNRNKLNALIELKGGLATYVTGEGAIAGTIGNDYIAGSAGNDTITSFGGDDIIYDASGNDEYKTLIDTNTLIVDKAGNDKLMFENESGKLLDNTNQKQIHVVFNVSKTYSTSGGAFTGNVTFVDNENFEHWKSNEAFNGVTVKGNYVETIQTADNYKLTSDNISNLAESVASWLSTYNNGAYANVNAVLNSADDEAISAMVAQFNTVNTSWVV